LLPRPHVPSRTSFRLTATGLTCAVVIALVPGLRLSAPAAKPDPGRVRDVALDFGTGARLGQARAGSARRLDAAPGTSGAWVSAVQPTGKARMLGISWDRQGADGAEVWFRTGTATGWSDWREGEPQDSGPDDGTGEAAAKADRVFTEPVWLPGDVSGVQVRVELPPTGDRRGRSVSGLAAHLVEPDMAPTSTAEPPAGSAVAATSRPPVITRARWGADERIRGRISYGKPVKVGFVHHTVQSNSYAASETAGLVRADYLYHVKSRGWSDVGYNFLIDRYGQIFEGRAGGMDRSVLGAHTGGMNSGSFGVALIGDFSSAAVPGAAQRALARLFAWKLDVHHSDPLSTTVMRSAGGGTSRYPAGKLVRVRNISGHRDTNLTACPGNRGYAILPALRRSVNATGKPKIYGGFPSAGTIDLVKKGSATFAPRFSSSVRWGATVVGADGRVLRRWGGTGGSARFSWNGRDTRGKAAALGYATITLTARTGGGVARSLVAKVRVTATQRVLAPPDGTLLNGGPAARVTGGSRWPYAGAAEKAADAGPSTAVTPTRAQGALLGGPKATFPDGVLVKVPGGGLYLVSDGTRRWVVSAASRAAHGLASTPVTTASRADLARLPEGPVLGAADPMPDGVVLAGTSRLYRMEGGRARPITTAAAAAWRARTPVAKAGSGVADPGSYPAGPALGFPDGSALRSSDGKVWVIADGTRRHLASATALRWLGYDRRALRAVRPADLTVHPVGAKLGAQSAPPSGALIRAGRSTWLVAGNRKVAVPGAVLPVLRQRVNRVSGGVAARLAGAVRSYPDGTYLRSGDRFWVVSDGRRRPVAGALSRGVLAPVATRPLTAGAFTTLPLGPGVTTAAPLADDTLWRSEDDGNLYRIESGRKRRVATEAEASWAPVPAATAPSGWAPFDDLPAGPGLGWRDGAIVRSTANGRVWVITGGQRRWVATTAALNAARLPRGSIVSGSESTLGLHRRASDLR
jgi:hypothetical protein